MCLAKENDAMIKHGIVLTLAALLLSGASVLTTVGGAAAQNAVLYEVTEKMKIKKRDPARVARAALMGYLDPDPLLCPEWLVRDLQPARCAIAVDASDNIDLNTGQGPVHAKFSILLPGDNPVDGPELVIAEGFLQGTIDLSPVLIGVKGVSIPLGTITAEWSARGRRGGPLAGLRAEGRLTGTFRLPFLDPLRGAAYMLNPVTYPAEGSAESVKPEELSLGVPTVRLELTFVEDMPQLCGACAGGTIRLR
jgi:hypothetical protein